MPMFPKTRDNAFAKKVFHTINVFVTDYQISDTCIRNLRQSVGVLSSVGANLKVRLIPIVRIRRPELLRNITKSETQDQRWPGAWSSKGWARGIRFHTMRFGR